MNECTKVVTVWGGGGGNKIKDFTGLSSTLTTFFQTHSTTVYSTWHSFYGIKSVSNTDVHYTAHSSATTASFFM